METTVKIDRIIKQVSLLDNDSKRRVVKKILAMLESQKQKRKPAKLTELKGLGAELWKDRDVDDFLKNERSWE